jgi:hypothetical protein
MPTTFGRGAAAIPKNIGQAGSRVAAEGRVGLYDSFASVVADLLELKAKFDSHTHVDDNALPPGPHTTSPPDATPPMVAPIAPLTVTVGTTLDTTGV